MNTLEQKKDAFARLLIIMDELRAQCPWDKKQTMQSLSPLTLEETCELAEAIIKNDATEIKKEIGDIMLHLVFYAKIASETEQFDVADVLHAICDKLVSRHPHIYGDVKVENEEQVKQNWEKLKLKEGNTSVLGGVPATLPALVKAMRVQEKAKGVGFDWDNATQVWEKVEEEILELKHEIDQKNTQKAEEEFGDLLFALVNYARFEGINPENALAKTTQKFIDRFQYIEKKAKENQKNIAEMPLDEMEHYWQEAKTALKK